jgi:hypothetical protein
MSTEGNAELATSASLSNRPTDPSHGGTSERSSSSIAVESSAVEPPMDFIRSRYEARYAW